MTQMFSRNNQEGLPDYWGIETFLVAFIYPPVRCFIRKDYPTTGVLKHYRQGRGHRPTHYHQEGLPDYWGIETTSQLQGCLPGRHLIRKDYPTTGVLKLFSNTAFQITVALIRKDYPTTGVLKRLLANGMPPRRRHNASNDEQNLLDRG